ncbi:murein hydrolase activator EnvC family protein [Thermoflavimicrobium dichotomicum]|uniref:Murein DD-endopeptidase MepM and murein hydrolase activator NlpD, contain LysM domain n=1 Tax=Thermoflavimicrobium dichotomicum TaxID=46223 RepID=A0A1I3JV15_9BACL|nr:peptidoglycan DD-metalloendopeptidase family protein [Thermoflavimicrobium dichotomicum]SFI64053.1 Murein DD-endopeptidase MepM and murein hydrolase activator NlpD, contain LysM domain [Thermoflavimicrobium dichotomicum]
MQKRWVIGSALVAALTTLFSYGNASAENTENAREKLHEVRKEKKDLLEEITKNDSSLKKYTDQIEQAENQVIKIQKQVDQKVVEWRRAKDVEKVYREKYNKRIRRLYQLGEFGYMRTLLSAKSFGQFLARFESVRLIMKQDYSLLKNRMDAAAAVQKKKSELENMRKQQQKLMDDSRKAYEELIKRQEDKKSELKKLAAQEAEYKDMVMEINKELLASGRLNFPFKEFTRNPLDRMRVTSHFNLSGRLDPVLGYVRPHKGTDFGAPRGTPIYAPGDGVVVENRPASGYGWILSIYHGHKDGKPVISRYGHCYGWDVTVEVGEEVEAGQMISKVGNNGQSTGAHLHFEIRRDFGRDAPAVDPLNWLN